MVSYIFKGRGVLGHRQDIFSELYAMEILFVVNFYRQNYKQAELLYNQFINGSYTESSKKLSKLNLLSDDKSGWAPGIKLLIKF